MAACAGGTSTVAELETHLREARFVDVSVEPKEESREFIDEWDPDRDLGDCLIPAAMRGVKPNR